MWLVYRNTTTKGINHSTIIEESNSYYHIFLTDDRNFLECLRQCSMHAALAKRGCGAVVHWRAQHEWLSAVHDARKDGKTAHRSFVRASR